MYKPILGLEIHIELNTKTKMFCGCLNDADEKRPNFNVCPICLGHPGTLPVINQEAVRKTIKVGLALNCQISEYSKFDRKNYFYPDLPKGYQISQYDMPFCKQGFLEIEGKKVEIRRVHLEEDTAKLIHPKGSDYSLVDFNRAGIPLMELVTEPDINSAGEARKFVEELQLIIHYLDVSDADMEKGQMRIEVNISLSEDQKIGTKVEIKNLNSFRSVEKAIEYEIERQRKVLESGKKIVQETRGWDDVKNITLSQREKEEAHDYRYFPEPDLPPLSFSKDFIKKIKDEITELPQSKRARFKKEYKLTNKEAEILVHDKDLGHYFEKVVSEFGPNLSEKKLSSLTKLSVNYLITDIKGLLKGMSVASEKFLITPENFAEFISLISNGKISSKIAKVVLLEMFKKEANPSNIIKEKSLTQISDQGEIEKIVQEVIKDNPKPVEDYKKGKQNAFQHLIGQIMVRSKGKANPRLVNQTLTKTLTKTK